MQRIIDLFKSFCKLVFFQTRIERDVAFSKIRFIPHEVCVEEGYGGKPVTSWPVYTFFRMYLNGQCDEAYSAYHDWLLNRLHRYHLTSPEKGGLWGTGTPLFRAIVEKYQENKIDCGDKIFMAPGIVSEVISEEVESRFGLLRSIHENGYKPNLVDPALRVQGFKRNGIIYLLNGHHRWAILTLLGYTSFDEACIVNVYDDKKWFQIIASKLHISFAKYNRACYDSRMED